MKKNILATLVATVMVVTLVGCGNNKEAESTEVIEVADNTENNTETESTEVIEVADNTENKTETESTEVIEVADNTENKTENKTEDKTEEKTTSSNDKKKTSSDKKKDTSDNTETKSKTRYTNINDCVMSGNGYGKFDVKNDTEYPIFTQPWRETVEIIKNYTTETDTVYDADTGETYEDTFVVNAHVKYQPVEKGQSVSKDMFGRMWVNTCFEYYFEGTYFCIDGEGRPFVADIYKIYIHS